MVIELDSSHKGNSHFRYVVRRLQKPVILIDMFYVLVSH